MKYLSLDIGTKRIGVAISRSGILAKELKTFDVSKNTIKNIVKLIQEEEIEKLIIGLPVSMDGVERDAAKNVRDFADQISKQINTKIEFEDERLTSVEAERQLKNEGCTDDEMKHRVDQRSAKIILEQYIDGLQY